MTLDPKILRLVKRAGYLERPRVRLGDMLTDLHAQPGCEGIGQRLLHHWLVGTSRPRNPMHALGLAKILGVPPEKLWR